MKAFHSNMSSQFEKDSGNTKEPQSAEKSEFSFL